MVVDCRRMQAECAHFVRGDKSGISGLFTCFSEMRRESVRLPLDLIWYKAAGSEGSKD